MSSDFALIANGDNARYYATVLEDGEILNIDIEDFKYQGAINADDNALIGNTCSSNVSFSIYNPSITLENKEIEIKQGLMINSSLENIKIGYFKIQKPTSDGEVTKYIGYDRMSLFEKPYFSSLTYPTTTGKIINEICTMVGVEFNTTLTVSYTISKKPEGYTCREMIGYLAALFGSNATINREGQLEFAWYKEVDYIVDGSKYYDNGININSENNFILKKITCTVTSGNDSTTLTVGNGQGISIENPLMTQSILYNIYYGKLNFFNYRAMSVKFLGDFRLDLGDIIKVKKGEKTYILPVMQIEHECDGGVITTISSFAKTQSEQAFDVKGPNTKAMERYYAELVLINEAMINKLDVDVAEITYATIANLEVTNEAVIKKLNSADAEILYAKITDLDVEKAKISKIEANMLTADSAVIKTMQTDVADINTLIFGSATGSVIQTEFANSVIAQLGNAQIKNAMIDSISAGKITSGKLYTNLVEITSQSGNIDIKDNTFKIIDGNSVVRVQIGKDASNDYNMYIWDASGNLMFDALGLTEKGIQREIIRNDMVSENANISASKLDIESLFDVINEDGSHTLKSSKIYVDADNQTLDLSFKAMTTNISNASTLASNALNKANANETNILALTETVTTQGTDISVIQGQISSKIWQQDITTAVDGIEIGGRNLLLDSDRESLTKVSAQGNRYFSDASYASVMARTIVDISDSPCNTKYAAQYDVTTELTASARSATTFFSQSGVKMEAGETYTMSCYARTIDASGTAKLYFQYGVTSYYNNANIADEITSDWKLYSWTFTAPSVGNLTYSDGSTRIYCGYVACTAGFIGNVQTTGYKLEKGNKVTDWTPAVEDTDYNINILNTKYSTLSQELDSISATVSSQATVIATKADNSTVTSIQSNLTELTADLNGFKTTVSNTYATVGTVNTLSEQVTEASQTAEKFNWLVASGSSSSSLTLTDSSIAAITKQLKVNGSMIVGDTNNLIAVNELIPDSVVNVKNNPSSNRGALISDGYITKQIITGDSITLTPLTPFTFRPSEQLYYSMKVKADSESSVRVMFFFTDENNTYKGYVYTDSITVGTEEQEITGYITIPESTSNYKKYAILLRDYTNTGQLYCKEAKMFRVANSVLIEDGSITASKIQANAITADMIYGGKLKSLNYVNHTSGSQFNLTDGSFSSKYLSWDKYGAFKCTGGNIGGWSIDDTSIYRKTTFSDGAGGTMSYWGEFNSAFDADAPMLRILTVEKAASSTIQTWSTLWYVDYQGCEYVQYLDVAKDIICYDDLTCYGNLVLGKSSSGTTYITDDNYGYLRFYVLGQQIFRLESEKITTGKKMQFTGTDYPQIIGNDTILSLSHGNYVDSDLVMEDKYVRPGVNKYISLGNPLISGSKNEHRWSCIYLSSSPDVSSDRNCKNTISKLDDDLMKRFIMELIPSSYKYNDGTSDRLHYGLIAQDVEQAMSKVGINSKDFGGFVKAGDLDECSYSLRYEEFIAPIIKVVQMHEENLTDINDRLDFITDLIQHLIGLVMGSIQSEDI